MPLYVDQTHVSTMDAVQHAQDRRPRQTMELQAWQLGGFESESEEDICLGAFTKRYPIARLAITVRGVVLPQAVLTAV
jgi:hypothetical protein